jgi:cytochrome b
MKMDRTRVYDLPTRLFHWLFAGVFVAAFVIAKTVDDESGTFVIHMQLGITLSMIVTLRIIWGLIGSRYARFSSFALSPKQLFDYFKQLLGIHPKRTLGHNPASSWAALLMMGFALGLGVTGYLMTSGVNKELFEEVHEVLGNALALTALLHVAGVTFHSVRHRDWIGLSMVSGNKLPVEGQTGIEKSHRGVALLFLVLVGGFALQVFQNYNSQTQILTLFGNSIQLGKSESKGHSSKSKVHDKKDHKEKDDHDEH